MTNLIMVDGEHIWYLINYRKVYDNYGKTFNIKHGNVLFYSQSSHGMATIPKKQSTKEMEQKATTEKVKL